MRSEVAFGNLQPPNIHSDPASTMACSTDRGGAAVDFDAAAVGPGGDLGDWRRRSWEGTRMPIWELGKKLACIDVAPWLGGCRVRHSVLKSGR